jgi:hypothetical protein
VRVLVATLNGLRCAQFARIRGNSLSSREDA